MKRDYTIGLDIGTASIGFVAVDSKQQILQYNNRYAFGTHEFSTAETAETTRLKRGTRRRYNRRKKRIQLTQQLFADAMKEHDFFTEKASKHFWRNTNDFENRTLSEVLTKLRIKQNTYPTIYHLRQSLIESKKKVDLHLVYLAIHNLVKYRGHFLQTGEWTSASSTQPISSQLEELFDYYNVTFYNQLLDLENVDYRALEEKLVNINLSKQQRIDEANEILGTKKLEFLKLLVGLKTNLDKLFPYSTDLELKKKKSIQLSKQEVTDIEETLVDEEAELFEFLLPVYQSIQLFDLLKGQSYVAAAKVKEYHQFGKDLDDLQSVFNNYLDETDYRTFFLTSKHNKRLYEVQPDKANLEKLSIFDRFLLHEKYEEEFHKQLKKYLQTAKQQVAGTVDEQKIDLLLKRIGDHDFLKKLKSKQNAAIPHQNSLYEAEQILRNQQAYYPFITEEFIQKVKQIIAFRIPYYIGPLSKNDASRFGWVSRTNLNESITPFNFEQIVNKSESAERFIRRMTNKCTYLPEEDVLPKCSLLYEEYEVRNELNVIQIRTSTDQKNSKFRFSIEEIDWIIEHVFKKMKTVKTKRLVEELKKSPFDRFKTDAPLQIYGTQKEDQFATSLAMYIDLEKIFGGILEEHEHMYEQIIEWLTIFEERSIFELKMKEQYPEITHEQIERLSRLKPTGWGRFSRKLLVGLPITDLKTGEITCVMDMLRTQTVNFMELMRLTDLKEKVEKLQKKRHMTKKISVADIQELPGSPALKRGIWHAIKIVEELTSIFGEPAHIVLEVARSDEEKKRSTSRQQLLKEYEQIAKQLKDQEIQSFLKNHLKSDDKNLQNERFWLYLTQQGRCMYSNEPLDIQSLSSYHIDHILPQNFVKDNSIANKVLVKERYNHEKGGNQTPLQIIKAEKRNEMLAFWARLKKIGMISPKKYESLCKAKFTDEDKEGFIARQLVETRQIIKNINLLLEERFETTTIHAIKAGMVSKFRQAIDLPKVREVNNKHHAMDALYAATFVQMIIEAYGENFFEFTFEKQALRDKWSRAAQTNKEFFLFEQMKEKELLSPLNQKKVSAHVYYREVFDEVPWNTTKQKRYGEKMFFNETIESPKISTAKYESGKNNIGVHPSIKKRCSWVISFEEISKTGKTKKIVGIVDVPTIFYAQAKERQLTKQEMVEALVKQNAKKPTQNVKFLYELKNYHKVLENGHPYYFMSSSERHVGKQFIVSSKLLKSLQQHISYVTENQEEWITQAKILLNQVKEQFVTQYPYFGEKMFMKIEKEIENVSNVDDFKKLINEIYKSAQNSGTRSDVLDSRLKNKFNTATLQIIEESITGLLYKKPKKVVAL